MEMQLEVARANTRANEAERKVAKLEAMPPQTVEAVMVDEDELNRRAQALADRQTIALRRDLDAANRRNLDLSRSLEALTRNETEHLHTLANRADAACRNAEAIVAAWLDTLRNETDEVYKTVTEVAQDLIDRIEDAVRYGAFESPASYHKEDADV